MRARPATAGLLLFVLLGALTAAVASLRIGADGAADVTGAATAAASSAAPGFAAREALPPQDDAPHRGWRSEGESIGAWIELSWPSPRVLREVTLTRSGDEPGATAGLLAFGNGSAIQVRLAGAGSTVVPIAARSVDRLRFTVSEVDEGATRVGLDRISVRSDVGPGDVDDSAPDGNAVPGGSIAQSDGGDASALADGSSASGAAGAGGDWTVAQPVPLTSVQVTWTRPRELVAVELVGSPRTGSSIRSAAVVFADGTRLPVGAVLPDPDLPTVVAFLPRVTTSIRLEIEATSGSGPLVLGELRAYTTGTTPPRAAPAAEPPDGSAAAASCVPLGSRPVSGLAVLCPAPASVVGDQVAVEIVVPSEAGPVTATAWPADLRAPVGDPLVVAVPDGSGVARADLDLAGLPPGPLTVAIETGNAAVVPVHLQLYRAGPAADPVPTVTPGAGRTLVYDEEFNGPVSLSRSGADAVYTAAKPVHGGEQDFGDAVFEADAARVVGNSHLRIDVAPLPAGTTDPQGWGRTHTGGVLASARGDGSGFSAQYGYFEARMLAPAGAGTWPAFWTLPADDLVAPTPVVAEIDAVELYGHDPTATCHATHEHNGNGGEEMTCGIRFPSLREALTWHTYGVDIGPTSVTFFVDGRVVTTVPQVDGGGSPMFFLVNLALGGGWPVQLGAVQDRASLYVDHIRVYV